MADTKISALPASTTPLAGTEVLPVVQSGVTKQVSVANLTAGRAVAVDSLAATTNVTATNRMAIGATPNASWRSTLKTCEISSLGMYWVQSNGDFNLGYNTIESAANSFVYKLGAIPAGRLAISDGLKYYNAVAGTNAGDPITFVQQIDVDSSGNIKANTGNFVQGTAAKGVNFTANTPAAGMTSQLLNWYEEGTWTPNQGAGLILVGAFSSAGTYTRIGRQVFIRGSVSGATSVAVASAGAITTNLPYSAAADATGTAINAANNASSILRVSSATLTAATAIAATTTITFSAVYSV